MCAVLDVLDVLKRGADILTFHAYRWIVALGSLLFPLPAIGFCHSSDHGSFLTMMGSLYIYA